MFFSFFPTKIIDKIQYVPTSNGKSQEFEYEFLKLGILEYKKEVTVLYILIPGWGHSAVKDL